MHTFLHTLCRFGGFRDSRLRRYTTSDLRVYVVGARGFEPLTSSVSRKRSPPELSARSDLRSHPKPGWHTASTAHEREVHTAIGKGVMGQVTPRSVSDLDAPVPSWTLSLQAENKLPSWPSNPWTMPTGTDARELRHRSWLLPVSDIQRRGGRGARCFSVRKTTTASPPIGRLRLGPCHGLPRTHRAAACIHAALPPEAPGGIGPRRHRSREPNRACRAGRPRTQGAPS